MSQRLLIVDDEEAILTLLTFNLEQAGFTVVTTMNGESALELATKQTFDLIILDIMLPKMNGLEVCKQLRQRKVLTPILMLTAKVDEFDKIMGLELGADDYMTKPFSPREVIARVRAILRRAQAIFLHSVNTMEPQSVDSTIKIGDVNINSEHHEVRVQDRRVELTPKEFELLVYLAKHKGRVITRDQLLNAVWEYDFVGGTRSVDVHISNLREKIESNSKKPVYIKTVRRLGYKMEEPK
ncbi:response regulator transcription factor [Alkalihalobacillus deserti]|uniref:response regulator transcription factor n=1 Tax=Alkalihalobacillus deserti TaxID=2879466 RepID=UPI001D158AFB|nr:response regulator transcription factor [Alkalihalobacillus deserti]